MQVDLVDEYYHALQGPRADQAMARFVSADYVEHQASAGYSRDGLLDWVERRRAAHPDRRLIVHRRISDADLVFLHVEERLDEMRTYARGELFRVAAQRIGEHWSAEVLEVKARKNPHGTFDGPNVNLASGSGRRSVDRFQALDARGFNHWDFDAFRQSRTERYLQHSPTGKDTVEGLIEILNYVKGLGIRMTMKNYHTLVTGDFIVTHRHYRTSPPFKEFRSINVMDLFRIDESGRADEHWDIMEEIADDAAEHKIF
jgi:predicted SnoaL-like aldol condensation-catalyzing enzyme